MLIGNGLLANKIPLSLLGLSWQNQVRDEAWPSYTVGGFAKTTAIPSGYGVGPSMVPPIRAGAISSHKLTKGIATAALSMASGWNLSGTADGSATASATMQLVVSMSGSAAGVSTVTGNIVAALGMSGSAAGSSTASGTIGALAWAAGSASGTSDASLVSYATGRLYGSITPYTELSPESLAAAVWSSLAASFNDSGTMGELLNGAGSAGNPWLTNLPGSYTEGQAGYILGTLLNSIGARLVENGMSQDEMTRIMFSVLAGNATDLEGPAPEFMSADGAKARVSSTYAAGTRTVTDIDGT